ncbi:DUF72 domain-containing protein [Acidovorax sp. BL-A-41-H1]|uniref:DUF72 domain-containing protein n=1 Tax=Acidovorax sp. BL-A-41-H1 TaxID=3421102 RepID=UPI003F7A4C17
MPHAPGLHATAGAQADASVAVNVGTAGWNLPRQTQDAFAGPGTGTHLQRYALRLGAVEINSSFYRPHQRATYARWAGGTPGTFRFSVKLPRAITHTARLAQCDALLEDFCDQVQGLGTRLGCLLVQLPPSLALDPGTVTDFLRSLRGLHGTGSVALEPRHASWFTPEADALLADWQVGRVLADPVLHPAGSAPGGWPGLVYCRLHGTPRRYYSAYSPALIGALAARLQQATHEAQATWCIFDNTASGAATGNAVALHDALTMLRRGGSPQA